MPLLALLVLVSLAIAAILALLFVVGSFKSWPNELPDDLDLHKQKTLPGVDVNRLDRLLTNSRFYRQAELEDAMADPQAKQRYDDYWHEREKVDPKP